MRALTVRQPWAGLIVAGIKTVENRTWSPSEGTLHEGERFYIHAGLGTNPTPPELAEVVAAELLCAIHGAIIGSVEFLGLLVPGCGGVPDAQWLRWWDSDRFGWQLARPQRIAVPIFCGGKLGLWRVAKTA